MEKTAAATSAVQPKAMRDGLFMVTCAARTGSSMLVNLLQSHPDVMSHMEIFNPERVEGFSGTYRTRLAEEPGLEQRMRDLRKHAPAAFLYKLAFDTQGRKHAGFKFKYEELLLPVFAGARAVLMADTDIKIIHLRRRNLLRRYLSWWVVNHVTGITMTRKGEEKPVVPPVRLDPAACQADFEKTLRSDAFVQRLFRNHQVLDINYEDLTGATAEPVQAGLLDFLGLPPHALRTVIARLAEDDLSRSIANFAELKAHFRNTPFIHYFQEA
jgi:LPS sulfotransferase NodH